MGWAASPSRVMRPWLQVGSGDRRWSAHLRQSRTCPRTSASSGVEAGEPGAQHGGVGLRVPVRALPGLGGDDHHGDLAALPYGVVHDVHAGRQPQADHRLRERSVAAAAGMTVRVAVAPTNTGCASGAIERRTLDHRPSAPISTEPVHRLARRAGDQHARVGVRGGRHLAAGAQLDAPRVRHRRQQGRVQVAAMGDPVRVRRAVCVSQLAERQAGERAVRSARRARRCVRARRPSAAGHRRCRDGAARARRWVRAGCRRLPSRTRRGAPARSALRPACDSASASASPPMPPPAISTGRSAAIVCAFRSGSGGGLGRLGQAAGRIGFGGLQAGVVHVQRRAVGAQDLAVRTHVQEDVRVIVTAGEPPCTGTPSRRRRSSPRPDRWPSGGRPRLPCALPSKRCNWPM